MMLILVVLYNAKIYLRTLFEIVFSKNSYIKYENKNLLCQDNKRIKE